MTDLTNLSPVGAAVSIGEYLEVERLPDRAQQRTHRWAVRGKRSGAVLGWVKWSGAWRQYCFFPNADTIFNSKCLRDIESFLRALMKDRET